MATVSFRLNRGATQFQVVSANPGAAVVDHDFEFNFTVGQARKLEPNEIAVALEYIKHTIESHHELWQGL
jgi:hypothetical protein